MDILSSATPPGTDLRQSEPTSTVTKPWYRRWWVYVVFGFLIFWFGTPFILRLVARNQLGITEPTGGFTVAPGTSGVASGGHLNVITTDDPSTGFAAAPVTIVEFGDFQCPYCREAAPIIRQVLAKYPEAVRLIYRDFPLVDVHDQAVAAAEAANCAGQQGKFWQFHDQLYANQERLGEELYLELARDFRLDLARFARCREGHLTLASVQADYEAGVAAGVQGTPTWFVNGYRLQGAISAEAWGKVIIEVLQRTLAQPKP